MCRADVEYTQIAEELIDFIAKSPTAYHAVAEFAGMLDDAGFSALSEKDAWSLEAGGRYYVIRGGSSVIAFVIPQSAGNVVSEKSAEITGFNILAAHSDLPSFKIKPSPEMAVDGHYICLNVEKYGGMLMAPWLDRPLSVAGRVVTNESGDVKPQLINIDKDLCIIPNLTIHMDREANSGYSYNAQKDMIPLIGSELVAGNFGQLINNTVACHESGDARIIASDLFLYNRQRGVIWGAEDEYISAPRLDDLMCAYSGMKALVDYVKNDLPAEAVQPQPKACIPVCAIFDNEEVGSTTKQGADSTFLRDTLERIAECLGVEGQNYKRMLASSFMISADNAHAVHPNHTDKADPTNRPYMNHGIVIKYNANQKYTTDAVSDAVFRNICEKAGVPCQTYTNRSDIPGGSTLGNISDSHISIDTVDIGLAQLAMHSPYETAGVKDTAYLDEALREYYRQMVG